MEVSTRTLLISVAIFLGGLILGIPVLKSQTNEEPIYFKDVYSLGQYAYMSYEDDNRIQEFCKLQNAECNIKYIEETQNKFFTAKIDSKKEYIISIRGTDNTKNALLDADFIKENDPNLKIKLHSGFSESAHKVFSEIFSEVPNNYSVLVTGHSLGGAEAVIVGMHLHYEGFPIKTVTTFGQPKVTDEAGAMKYSKLIPLTRIVNHNDIVPLTPPTELIYLLNPYKHFGRQVYLMDGEYITYDPHNVPDNNTVNSFWKNIKNEPLLDELSDHRMKNYLANIKDKIDGYKIQETDSMFLKTNFP